MSDSSSNPSSEQPSMIGGHIKYAQGAISSALGYSTGEQTKSEAVSEMREANQQPSSTGQQGGAAPGVLGSVENAAGKLVGCEGMENNGGQKASAGKAGIEEQSGTG